MGNVVISERKYTAFKVLNLIFWALLIATIFVLFHVYNNFEQFCNCSQIPLGVKFNYTAIK